MSLQLLLKGLTIGFSIAAPVGPIGLLCIRRAVAEGQRAGFICGLGAATADAAYALIGGFAMTALARWLVQEKLWFGLAGGLFLIYLGLRTMAANSGCEAAATLVGGVFAGSALWWLLLSGVAGRAQRHLSTAMIQTMNPSCSLVIAAFGCYAIGDAVIANA